MLDKIRKAWKRFIYKGRELGKRSHGASDAYKAWVRSRVEEIKLPFQKASPKPPPEIDTVMEECDDMKRMKEQLARTEAEKEELETELKGVRLTLEAMKLEASEKDQSLKQANKRARVEERSRYHISAANQDLKKQIAEYEKAVGENEQFRKIIGELEQQVAVLKIKMEKQESHHESNRKFDKQTYTDLIREYQGRLEEEQLKMQKLTRAKEAALEENWQLRGEMVNLKAAEAEAQRRLIDLDLKMNETISLYVDQYEEKITDLKIGLSGTIHRLRVTIDRKDEELRGLQNWAKERNHLLRLIKAAEANYIEAWYGVAH